MTVRADTPSVSAVSSTENPPKNRNSTTWLGRGSSVASSASASFRATTSTPSAGAATSAASERQSLHALTTLRRLSCPRGVHQHATHHPGGGREEVRPVLPVHRVPVEQANVRLLHEVGRLPSNGQPLAREHPASHLPQFALDERNELFQGLRVPAAPRLQQPGHIGGHHPRILSLSSRAACSEPGCTSCRWIPPVVVGDPRIRTALGPGRGTE